MSSKPFQSLLEDLHRRLAGNTDGNVAGYIPELAKADPNHLAIVVATTDGVIHSVGHDDVAFTIQSMSKPFAYAHALERLGQDEMSKRVGVEPTGDAFNSIVLDQVNKRPFNPMVNAGAIAVSALHAGATREARVADMMANLSRFAGRPLVVDDKVFRSEAATGNRNRAISWMMLANDMLALEPEDALDTYFRQCAALVTARDLALMAATLANGGVNPRTDERVVSPETVASTLSVMLTCGMYDYAGQWAYDVGLPAKSGVAGGVIAVVPGQFGIAVYSPRLDRFGNSVRGVEAIRELSRGLGLHGFRNAPDPAAAIRRELTARFFRSHRDRSRPEQNVLDQHGDRIVVLEASGDLFVGAAERIVRRLDELALRGITPVLDLRRVTHAAASAEDLLFAEIATLAAARRPVMLAHLDAPGISPAFRARLAAADFGAGVVVAEDTDRALEEAENRLVAEHLPTFDREPTPLSEIGFLRGFDDTELAAFVAEVQPRRIALAPGDVVVREGDPADNVYSVAAGSIRVELRHKDGPDARAVRLIALGPGMTFGELALLDGGTRSADVVAETDAACYAFPIDRLRALATSHPPLMRKILASMIRDLSDRLRRANATIRALDA